MINRNDLLKTYWSENLVGDDVKLQAVGMVDAAETVNHTNSIFETMFDKADVILKLIINKKAKKLKDITTR